MKKFLTFVGAVVSLTVLAIVILFLAITLGHPGAFSHTYQSVIQDKYENLRQTSGPKIILVGGSSVPYGIREEVLEEEMGMPVCSIGLYGGLGDLFQTQLVKANLQKGDIVVLAYEYNWIDAESFTYVPADMVMSGIDDKISMYTYLPPRVWPQLLGYLTELAGKKKAYAEDPGEDVHHTLFDENGRLVEVRDHSLLMNYDQEASLQNPIDLTGKEVSEKSADYLRSFAAYCKGKGASLVMSTPPLYEGAAVSDRTEYARIYREAFDKTGIPCISDPSHYMYPADLMYDTVYHCNDQGALRRTITLAGDLKAAGLMAGPGDQTTSD